MPSEPMNIQEQGFRSSLFGFDKNDVLAYMNALANEAQQHELEYNRQLQQLQSKLDELRSQPSTPHSPNHAQNPDLAAPTHPPPTPPRTPPPAPAAAPLRRRPACAGRAPTRRTSSGCSRTT